MIWSFSASGSFRRCPRQWFYKQFIAHHAAKDPARREAYLLSKLDSLWSWRGRLVDDVITHQVIPTLAAGRSPELVPLLDVARGRYEAQLAFAGAHRLREANMRPSQHSDFAAFRQVEWGVPLTDTELAKTWDDIEAAVTNLLTMDTLLGRLKGATLLLPQRALTYKHDLLNGDPVTVRAVPDLLAFFCDAPPLIVDWKVHSDAATDYRKQLAGYALALTRCNGQRGLPDLSTFAVTDVNLIEVQLLTGELRSYTLTDKDVEDVDTYVIASTVSMQAMLMDHKTGDFDPFIVPTTPNLNTCTSCNFKAPCWKEPACRKSEAIPIPF